MKISKCLDIAVTALTNRDEFLERARPRLQGYALRIRIRQFETLSTNRTIFGQATIATPVLAIGDGTINAQGAQLGFWPSPHALDGVIHLEARSVTTSIDIGQGAVINNGCVLISEGPGIAVGPRTLVGPGVTIFDTDFHGLDPRHRLDGSAAAGRVSIGENVFLGANCCVMKGVTIGDNSVIGTGSVVVSDIPADVIAAGNPCRVLRPLELVEELH